MNERKGVVIVGAGASGCLAALHLLHRGDLPVTLLDDAPTVGAGIAYKSTLDCHVLNVRATGMSAYPDDASHFTRWLSSRAETRNWGASDFVPRQYYAEYLRATLEQARCDAGGSALRWCPQRVADIEHDGTRARVMLANGESLLADNVVLAMGTSRPEDPATVDAALRQSGRYVPDVWASGALDFVGGSVLIVGSGLTAVDSLMELKQRGCRGPFHILSRHGRFPAAHADQAGEPYPWPQLHDHSLVGAVHAVRRELEAAREEGRDWRPVIDGLRPISSTLWLGWSLVEKRRFMRHVRTLWDSARHRMAPRTATAMDQLIADERVRVHAGTLVRGTASDRGITARIRHRDGRTRDLVVSTIVNCTGPASDVRKLDDALIANLLQRGLIVADTLGLGIYTDDHGRVVARNGRPVVWMYTLGPLRKAALWETTAIPEIRQQAVALASRISAQTRRKVTAG